MTRHSPTASEKSAINWVDMTISGKISRMRAIFFDGDMTRWDFEKVMRNSLAHVLTELRVRLPRKRCADLTVDRMIEIRNAVAEKLKANGPRWKRSGWKRSAAR